jgi:hypothetical protein
MLSLSILTDNKLSLLLPVSKKYAIAELREILVTALHVILMQTLI